MTTPTDINTICSIRKRQQIFNQPLNRLEIISPYKNTNFTTYQLNMKRKVQILKYENDSSQETTSSSWSRLSRNRNNLNFILRKDQSFYDKNTNSYLNFSTPSYLDTSICPNSNELNIQFSKSSDIPGPNIPLYDEPGIPIYMYKPNRVSGIDDDNETINFQVLYQKDYFLPQSVSTEFFTIYISEVSHDEPTETFEATFPLSFYFNAYLDSDISNGDVFLQNNKITLQQIDFEVFYNGELVPTNHIIRISNSNMSFNNQSNNLAEFDFDISLNATTDNQITYFRYLTTLKVSNINLPINNGFFFDMHLNITYGFEPQDKALYRTFVPNEVFGSYVFPLNSNLYYNLNVISNNLIDTSIDIDNNLLLTSNKETSSFLFRVINDIEIVEIPVVPTTFLNIDHIFLTPIVLLHIDKLFRYVLRNTKVNNNTNIIDVEPTTFSSGRKYYLTEGEYFFFGIGESFAFTILNLNNPNILIEEYNKSENPDLVNFENYKIKDYKRYDTVYNSTNDGDYTFFTGNV